MLRVSYLLARQMSTGTEQANVRFGAGAHPACLRPLNIRICCDSGVTKNGALMLDRTQWGASNIDSRNFIGG